MQTVNNKLPGIFNDITNYLTSCDMQLICCELLSQSKQVKSIESDKTNSDGRITSAINERVIVDLLLKQYPDHVRDAPQRYWYDIKVLVHEEWMPVNIKITSMTSADNAGSYPMCAWAYTSMDMDIDTLYQADMKLMKSLLQHISEGRYNYSTRDYYFLVVNKKNNKDIFINSLKGLTILTKNKNNLPFQISWKKNKVYNPLHINKCIEMFRDTQCGNISPKEMFLYGINQIQLPHQNSKPPVNNENKKIQLN